MARTAVAVTVGDSSGSLEILCVFSVERAKDVVIEVSEGKCEAFWTPYDVQDGLKRRRRTGRDRVRGT